MDDVQILNPSGDRVNPARLRITHQERVLDTDSRITLEAIPKNRNGLAYPLVTIDETPPVRCFLYDWLQWINFRLQREFGNIITAKELQQPTQKAFDVFPRSQGQFVDIQNAAWEPVYTDLPAETAELYNLLDRLTKLPPVVFEPQELVSSVRITNTSDTRVTANGDRRIAILNVSPEQLFEAA